MIEPRNQVIQISRFGDSRGLEIVDAPLPIAGPGELRVRVLASSLSSSYARTSLHDVNARLFGASRP
jgi:hypothetical protein